MPFMSTRRNMLGHGGAKIDETFEREKTELKATISDIRHMLKVCELQFDFVHFTQC